MPAFEQPMFDYVGAVNAIPKTYQGVSNEYFINRTPLFARLPKTTVGGPVFQLVGHKFRTRTVNVTPAVASTATATWVLTDATNLMAGDVLKSTLTNEMVEVQSVNADGVTVVVNRAIAGTTGVNVANNTVFNLIGNSRTGGEINQAAVASLPTTIDQYVQTYQHPIQIAGIVQASSNYVLAPGRTSPYNQLVLDSLQNIMDDIEVSSYYGIGESFAAAASKRGKQNGLRALIQSNNVTTPTNASTFKPSDFMSQAITPCWAKGGNPDTILCSTDWQTGLAQWSFPIQRLDSGESKFGEKISAFMVPFLADITFIPCVFLNPGTACVLSSAEVRYRMQQEMTLEPLAKTGDAIYAQWLCRAAVELENEQHHAWIEGITGFAPQS